MGWDGNCRSVPCVLNGFKKKQPRGGSTRLISIEENTLHDINSSVSGVIKLFELLDGHTHESGIYEGF